MVVDVMRVQDSMIERMADKLIAAMASILESRRAHRVEEKAVEEVGVGSGGHDAQVMVASAVAAAAPMATAVKRRNRRKTARKKTAGVGGSLVSTDDGSTDSTVLLESRSDVDDRTESTDDMRMGAADGAESVVGRMQAVEEVIDEEADYQGSAGAEVLPPDGGVQQRLEKELESARLGYARQMLREEEYSSEGAGSDGYEGCVEESFSARADGGFDRIAASAEFEGDVRCRAAITAMVPAGKAGARRYPEGVDDVGASAGADEDCGKVAVAQSEKFWADVGGSSPDPTCIVDGDGADRGELASGGTKSTGAYDD